MPHDIQIEVQVESRDDAVTSVDLIALREVVSSLLDGERSGGAALAIQLAGDELLQALNREHRGVDVPTDVLSFRAEEGAPFPSPDDESASYLGDIAVSVAYARRQALEFGVSLDEEIRHVVVHGVLHLLGYDHETEAEVATMQALEEGLLGAEIHLGRAHEDG